MASLQSRLSSLITAIGTDIKILRTMVTGTSSGDLSTLETIDKSSLVGAINEIVGAYQPLSSALTTLAGVTSGTFGRTLLAETSAENARDDLGVYSQTQLGDPDTDLAASYETAKA